MFSKVSKTHHNFIRMSISEKHDFSTKITTHMKLLVTSHSNCVVIFVANRIVDPQNRISQTYSPRLNFVRKQGLRIRLKSLRPRREIVNQVPNCPNSEASRTTPLGYLPPFFFESQNLILSAKCRSKLSCPRKSGGGVPIAGELRGQIIVPRRNHPRLVQISAGMTGAARCSSE